VILATPPGEWVLTIRDDGRGFDPQVAASPDTGHFGLVGMEERVQRLGGSMEVASKPGQGCNIRFGIPMERS
jgi:signal transduction histidine kinase